MESVRVNLRFRDDAGNILRATEVQPVPLALTIPLGLVVLGLLLKLMMSALILL